MTVRTTIETRIISHSPKSFAEVVATMAQNATVRTVAETLDAALEELVERCVLTES